MELISKVMPSDYEIIHASDLHLGPLTCYKQGIRDMVNYVKQMPNTYLVFTGDACDAVTPSDKRYVHASMDREEWVMTPQQQADKVIELFDPIRDRILLWGLGNHEHAMLNIFDIAGYIADNLGVPWGGAEAKFTARFANGRVAHKFFFAHGYGSLPKGAKDPIQRKANRRASLKQKMIDTCTDAIYHGCGHFHQDVLAKPTVGDEILLTDDGKEIIQEARYFAKQNVDYIPPECRWYACSPGFLKTFTPTGIRAISYSEMRMYPPTRLGWLRLVIEDYKLHRVYQVDANEYRKGLINGQ